MSSIHIYIPRILGSVKKSEIIDTFKRMDIGQVTFIDMHRKINENNNSYYYAFIKINLFSTIRSNNFQKSVCEFGMIRLLYDEESVQYWEIKHHVEKIARVHCQSIRKIVPFYRYDTLFTKYFDNKENEEPNEEPNEEDDNTEFEEPIQYKAYNLWDDSFELLSDRRTDLLC